MRSLILFGHTAIMPLSMALTTMFASNASQAADLQALELEELMHINVTVGSLFDENELYVGNTIDVIVEDDWQKHSAKDILGALEHLPSVLPLENLWGSAVSIRGYTTNLSVRGVSYLVDGISVNNLSDMTASYDLPLQDLGGLQKIEVLRGPGSSVHGTDAFHGVLSLNTFAKNEDYSAVKLDQGNDGWSRNQFRSSQSVGTWRMNVSLSSNDQDARNIHYQYTDPSDDIEKGATRNRGYYSDMAVMKLGGPVSSSTDIHFAAYSSQWRADEGPGGVRGLVGQGASLARDRDVLSNDSDFSMGKIQLETRLPQQVDLIFNSYYWDQNTERELDFTRVDNRLITNTKKEIAKGIDVTLKQEQTQNEYNTQWLVRYQHRDGSILRDQFTFHNLSTGNLTHAPSAANGYERETHSLVIQGKTGIANDLIHLLYGGRIDNYDDVGTHKTPRAGLIYHPTDDSSIKLIYGQAFRAPSANEILGSQIVSPNPDLKPETIDTYELSYLSHFTRSRLLVTLFTSRWQDGIEVRDSVYQNKEKNKSVGLELSYSGFKGNFQYNLNGSYIESEDVGENIEFSAFPETILNLGLGYDWPGLDVSVYWSNRLLLNMDEGPVTDDISNPDALPHYFRSNLNLAWKPTTQIETWLDIRNLFDRDNQLPSIWNAENGYMEDGINFSVGARLMF